MSASSQPATRFGTGFRNKLRNRLPRAFGLLMLTGMLAACETMNRELDPQAATPNPFARVFASSPVTDTARSSTGQPATVSRNFETKPKIYQATGPRVGKAVYGGGSKTSGGFNVNFSEADLQEVVQTILGDLLDQPFVLDPRVQGKVTAATGGPVSRDALVSLLETVLSMNSAALVRSETAWRIGPAGEIFAGGQTRFTGSDEPGFGITLVPLTHVSATNMIGLLENTVTRAGTMKPDLVRNLLFITGNGTERANAFAAIKAFDVDWMAGMATGIFPLKNASASDVIAELEVVMQTGTGGGLEGAIQLLPIERVNAVLVVAPGNAILQKAGRWIERLDTGGPSDTLLRTYKIDNGKALETADLLNALFGGSSTQTSSSIQPDLAQTSNSSRRTSSTANRSQKTGTLTKNNSSVPRIIGDPINNKLVVLATPQGQQMVAQALREIDQPPAQVLIDMVIAEVKLNDTLRYGVQYFFTTGEVAGIGDSGRGGFSTGGDFDANGVFPGFNFILDEGTDARFALDLLDSITDLKIVSSPHVVALDNQPARLQVGDEVPVITRQTQDVVNANSPQVNSVEFRETGVILEVTPRISSTGLVTMEIRQEVSSVSTTASTGDLTPTISKREMQSTVAARSGQTVILGGLISDSLQNGTTGLPGLSRVPVVKDMFGGHNIETKRNELLVFITPRVLDIDKDMSKVVEEIKSRMVLISREADKANAKTSETSEQ